MDPSQYQLGASGCVAAFRSVKAAKNCFMLLVAVAIVAQLASFVLINWAGVIDQLERKPPPAAATATRPATQEAGQSQDVGAATIWREALLWAMPATRFLAFVAGLLTVLTIMFAVKLSIVGRLGGIPGFMSAFFWSLIMMAFITPWQQVLDSGFACGALYNLGELTQAAAKVKPSWGATDVQLLDQTVYYGRFVAYPAVALLIWLTVLVKFAEGYKESIISPIGTVPQQQPGEPNA